MSSVAKSTEAEQTFQRHAALVYDLCDSVLWDSGHAQQAYLWISKKISKAKEVYQKHERSWILQVSCERIREIDERHGLRLTASEQIELDSAANTASRLKRFNYYYQRLTTEQRLLLALKDRHGVPYDEIGAALGVPVESLKILRQQALRTLEEWIWEGK